MPIESAADRAVFIAVADFGTVAAYSQNEGREVAVVGIFDRQHLAIEVGDGGVTGFSIAFMCRADDLKKLTFGRAVQGDRLTIEGERWRVIEPQPDGTGMVTLILRKD